MPNTQQSPGQSPVMEALQMRRDIAAYHAVMSGEFDKELRQLEKLLDEIKKANAPRDTMKKAEAKMAEAETLMAAALAERKAAGDQVTRSREEAEKEKWNLVEINKKMKEREVHIGERETLVAQLESKNEALKATLDKRARDIEEVRIAAEAELTALRASLDKRTQEVTIRERSIADKFEKIRGIAVAN